MQAVDASAMRPHAEKVAAWMEQQGRDTREVKRLLAKNKHSLYDHYVVAHTYLYGGLDKSRVRQGYPFHPMIYTTHSLSLEEINDASPTKVGYVTMLAPGEVCLVDTKNMEAEAFASHDESHFNNALNSSYSPLRTVNGVFYYGYGLPGLRQNLASFDRVNRARANFYIAFRGFKKEQSPRVQVIYDAIWESLSRGVQHGDVIPESFAGREVFWRAGLADKEGDFKKVGFPSWQEIDEALVRLSAFVNKYLEQHPNGAPR
jgi:hypothetical protein